MRSSSIFREYVWLLSTIRDAGSITFNDIASRWANASINETGQPMARTTFNRHRMAIEEIFDIEIKCDRSAGNKYHIEAQQEFSDSDTTNWLCNSLVTGTMLSDFKSIGHRISLEPVPTAGTSLRLILEAMTQSATISFTYHRLAQDPDILTAEPYAVKLFKQRWYMLGHVPGTDGLRLFSLERLDNVGILTDRPFTLPDDFSAQDYWNEIYGVMSAPAEVECQRVVLRSFGRDRFYLEDLPMHPSQRVVERGDVYTDFELWLKPTPDFAAAILSRGGWVKVLEPEWFADELIDRAAFTLDSYETPFPD